MCAAYGLKPNVDLEFVKHKGLQQVCVGFGELVLNFDQNLRIIITSAIGLELEKKKRQTYEDFRQAVAAVSSLMGNEIKTVEPNTDGTLKLTFEGGQVLTLFDDSKEYESYVIKCGDKIVVV